ncbi:MAG: Mth938-like domain-containing protein [Zoogloeaceae bacterium]|nr:Mth938-like domain-containing protein [Zoogloeaceae bacterium]
MKLQPDRNDASLNIITAVTPSAISVNAQALADSLIVPWRGPVQPWACREVGALTEAHLELVASMEPEVVLLGTGRRLCFAPPALLRPLMHRRIGLETMDTAAACRTFNILAGEGRSVVALLMLPTA